VRRGLLYGHPFLTEWTGRRSFAVATLAVILLLALVNVDPRVRAGARYARPPAQYVIPVSGVEPRHVKSSWGAPRSGGRSHEGIDILAPRGRTVVSATDGVIWTVGRNELGGNAVWVLGEGWTLYYYAHLDAWAAGIEPGVRVRAGDALGSVGTTGNARGGAPHLHFAMTQLFAGWGLVDPAPYLRAGRSLPAATLTGGTRTPPSGTRPGGREELVMPSR
jgi:peptidoglycan LD-endopeptidase LytH